VSTGGTLKANGLVEVEHIMDISARLIVNQAALKTRTALLKPLIAQLREAAQAQTEETPV
jgi:ATP phosphoribosyltransferase